MLGFQQQLFEGLQAFLKGIGFYEDFKLDKEAINSMNAFYCATTVLATQNLNVCEKKVFFTPMLIFDVHASSAEGLLVGKYGDTRVYCNKNEEGEITKCKIEGFSLPQEIEDSLIAPYIKAFSDPKYVFYYEEFPKAEFRAWIGVLEEDNLLIGAGIAAVTGAFLSAIKIPGLGKLTKNELINKAIQKISKKTINKKAEINKKIEKTLEKIIVGSRTDKPIALNKEEIKNLKELLLRAAAKKNEIAQKELDDVLKNPSEKKIKDLLSLNGDNADKIARNLKESLEYLTELETKGVASKIELKGTRKKLYELLFGINLYRGVVAKDVKKSIDSALKINAKMEQLSEALNNAIKAKLEDAIKNDPKLVYITVEAITSSLTDKDIEDLEETKIDAIAKGIEYASLAEKISFNARQKIASPAVCAALYYLGYQITKMDLENEKNDAWGYNKFFLYSPQYALNLAKYDFERKHFEIKGSEELNDYILVLETDNNKEYKQFYLVSPCYADLEIKKRDKIHAQSEEELMPTLKVPYCPSTTMLWGYILGVDNIGKEKYKEYVEAIAPSENIKQKIINKAGNDKDLQKKIYEYCITGDSSLVSEIGGKVFNEGWLTMLCGCVGNGEIGKYKANDEQKYVKRQKPYNKNLCSTYLVAPRLPILWEGKIVMISPLDYKRINNGVIREMISLNTTTSENKNNEGDAIDRNVRKIEYIYYPCSLIEFKTNKNEEKTKRVRGFATKSNPGKWDNIAVMGIFKEVDKGYVPLVLKNVPFEQQENAQFIAALGNEEDIGKYVLKNPYSYNIYDKVKDVLGGIPTKEIPIRTLSVTVDRYTGEDYKYNFCYYEPSSRLIEVMIDITAALFDIAIIGAIGLATGGGGTVAAPLVSAATSAAAYYIKAEMGKSRFWPNNPRN